jgi:hypothetical protein
MIAKKIKPNPYTQARFRPEKTITPIDLGLTTLMIINPAYTRV